MSQAAEAIAQGVAALNAGQPSEAIGPFFEAVRRDAADEQGWLGLALALTLEGRGGDLLGLINHRATQRGDGFLFTHAVCGMLLTYRLFVHLRGLARLIDPTSPYRAPVSYALGCADLLDGQEDAAFGWFADFKERASRAVAGSWPVGPESPFNIAYRQGCLIEDRAWVDALGDGPPAIPGWSEPTIWPRVGSRVPSGISSRISSRMGAPANQPVIAAACDRHYFGLFAAGLVDSLARQRPDASLHLHIVAPDAATREQAEALGERHPALDLGFSSEPASPYESGAYYASNRFLIAPALRRHYAGRGLFLIDVDVEIQAPLDPLYQAAADADHVGFRYEGIGPCSRYPAVATWWGTGTGATRLLDRVNRFIAAKLDIPWPFNWMLDQAALGSVRRWADRGWADRGWADGGWADRNGADREAGIRLATFNDLTGQHFQPWLRAVGGDEKAALIRAAAGKTR